MITAADIASGAITAPKVRFVSLSWFLFRISTYRKLKNSTIITLAMNSWCRNLLSCGGTVSRCVTV